MEIHLETRAEGLFLSLFCGQWKDVEIAIPYPAQRNQLSASCDAAHPGSSIDTAQSHRHVGSGTAQAPGPKVVVGPYSFATIGCALRDLAA